MLTMPAHLPRLRHSPRPHSAGHPLALAELDRLVADIAAPQLDSGRIHVLSVALSDDGSRVAVDGQATRLGPRAHLQRAAELLAAGLDPARLGARPDASLVVTIA